jgi:hypothetical protein
MTKRREGVTPGKMARETRVQEPALMMNVRRHSP